MNVAFSKPMTLAEFLEWEEQQPLRYEFDGLQPVAMTGGTAAHADIQANIAASLRGRLRGKPCKYYGNDLKIEAAGHIRYPDGFVVCSPVANASTVVRDPVVIFEVLSPGTSSTDRIVKNQEYRATLSIQRYIILEQDRIAATVFARTGGEWSGPGGPRRRDLVHARDRDRGSSRRILRRPRPWHPRGCQRNWAHRLWAPFMITLDEALEVPFVFLI